MTIVVLLSIFISGFMVFPLVQNVVATPSNEEIKPIPFYFHYVDEPMYVAGIETHYIMNTTNWFRFVDQEEAYVNAFHKPIGLPKIVIDFYLYPNLAGLVTVDGTWQVFVWINSSAYKPCGFNLQFKEISLGGVTLWDSGALTPIVTSEIGAYIDVPIYNYNLSVPSLSHTFSAGTTLQVEVSINTGAAAACQLWYDSPSYQSKVILPCGGYAKPKEVKTFNVNDVETNVFSVKWSEEQRKVIIHGNVSDPFGGYDIHKVTATILNPTNKTVLDEFEMDRTSNGQWKTEYQQTYEVNWAYPETATFGNYTMQMNVIDNNAQNHYQRYGVYPQTESLSYVFNIGRVILHDPVFKVVDDAGAPLLKAQIYVQLPNGTSNSLPLYTAENGFLNLTSIPTGNCTFTILWKDVIVLQATVYVDSDGPFTISCTVHQLVTSIIGNDGQPVEGAFVVVRPQAEIVFDFKMTNSTGQAIFQLPPSTIQAVGMYDIDVFYSTAYWLTHVSVEKTEPSISVTSSGSLTITLDDFPPQMWTTTGFWLIVTCIAIPIIGFVLYRRRK
jgi:hypothetical protein